MIYKKKLTGLPVSIKSRKLPQVFWDVQMSNASTDGSQIALFLVRPKSFSGFVYATFISLFYLA